MMLSQNIESELWPFWDRETPILLRPIFKFLQWYSRKRSFEVEIENCYQIEVETFVTPQDMCKVSDKVYKELSAMINAQNGDYVKTANFNAAPVYSYKNDKKNLIKYEVSNNVIVHTKNIKDAGKMIDKAISSGATNINDITFSLSSYDKQCDELLSLAGKKAYKRAGLLAASAGNTLAGIKSINGSCSTNDVIRPQYRLLAKNVSMGASADAAVESASPIQGGVIKLFANINASYFVK